MALGVLLFAGVVVAGLKSGETRPVVIAIDPGHGGRDPGAIGCHGVEEKNITLAIGKDLAVLIDQHKRLRAVLTRKGDYYVSLQRRVQIARAAGARLFVAIHGDAGNPSWDGATVYTQEARDTTGKASDQLADIITRELRHIEPAHHDRHADFVVLRSSRIPAVLVEVGYVTNVRQARKLTTKYFQKKIAVAISHGIDLYLREQDMRP